MLNFSSSSHNFISRISVKPWHSSIVGAHRDLRNFNSFLFLNLHRIWTSYSNKSQSWTLFQIIRALYSLFFHELTILYGDPKKKMERAREPLICICTVVVCYVRIYIYVSYSYSCTVLYIALSSEH